jgi:exportin-7
MQEKPSQTLLSFLDAPSNFKQIYSVLISSRHGYLLYLSTTTICKFIPNQWKSLTLQEKDHVYNTFFNLLFSSDPKPSYLIGGLSKTLARICRLAWMELNNINKTVDVILQILEINPDIIETSLKFFTELIIEIVEPIKHRTQSVNKQIAVKFRDEALGKIFSYSIRILINNMSLNESILGVLLNLINSTLMFDFLGIASDETNEDVASLQIPFSWKSHFENLKVLETIEYIIIYKSQQLEYIAIRVLNQMGAIRKSLFSKSEERYLYINKYSMVLLSIIQSRQLSKESLFEFLLAIKRFLSNFLVKEISAVLNFNYILEVLAKFSLSLLSNPETLMSFSYNSLSIWGYLSYEGHSQNESISNYIPIIIDLFLEKSLNAISEFYFTPEKENDLKELLECIGQFSINYYPYIFNSLQTKLFEEFEYINVGVVREYKVSWLMHISSSLLSTENKKTGRELDDKIAQNAINLILKMVKPNEYVELSILSMFNSIIVIYLGSSIDTYWEDSTSMIGEMSLGQVCTIIIERLLNNFNTYTQNRVLEYSLQLLEKLCIGYYSNKILTGLPQIRNLLAYPVCTFSDRKLRSKFFTAVTQLWITDEESPYSSYNTLVSKIKNLSRNPNDFIEIFSEIQGILKAIVTSRHFLEFFELIHEDIWELIRVSMDYTDNVTLLYTILDFLKEISYNRNSRMKFNVSDASGITIFKNISEVLHIYSNINIVTKASDPNKIEKKAKKVIAIVNKMLDGDYVSFGVFEVYKDETFIKTISMCFHLINSLDHTKTVSTTQSHPKLMDCIYNFLELLCRNSQKTLFLHLPHTYLSTVLSYLISGVKSTSILYADLKYCVSSSNAISYLCEYIIKSYTKAPASAHFIKKMLEIEHNKLYELFEAVLEVVFSEESSFMWGVSKALLGLAIIDEAMYQEIKDLIVSKIICDDDVRVKLVHISNKLLEGVRRSLDTKNKDLFSKNFTNFKQDLIKLIQ